jgi:hypothetical protein
VVDELLTTDGYSTTSPPAGAERFVTYDMFGMNPPPTTTRTTTPVPTTTPASTTTTPTMVKSFKESHEKDLEKVDTDRQPWCETDKKSTDDLVNTPNHTEFLL